LENNILLRSQIKISHCYLVLSTQTDFPIGTRNQDSISVPLE
jgi:hypothetical protein